MAVIALYHRLTINSSYVGDTLVTSSCDSLGGIEQFIQFQDYILIHYNQCQVVIV